MFTEQPGIVVNHKVTVAMSKGAFVNFAGDGVPMNVKGLGVVAADTSAGDAAPVVINGIAMVTSGGAIAIGDPVISDMMGRAVVQGAVDTKHIMGYALDAAAGSGALIRIRMV